MATLSQMPLTFLQGALTANPKSQFFPWALSDFPFPSFPQGVPRASVLSAYKTAAMQFGNFYLVPLGSDNFQRANESPLIGSTGVGNPARWTDQAAGLQLLNHQAWALATSSDCSAVFTGSVLPNDQWVSVTVGTFDPSSIPSGSNPAEFILGLRTTAVGTFGYSFDLSGFSNSSALIVVRSGSNVLVDITSPVINPGDVITAVAVGTQMFLFQNSNLISNTTDSAFATGFAALKFPAGFTQPGQGSISTSVINFACGAAYGGPNLSVV
jgi:hypothetical protein